NTDQAKLIDKQGRVIAGSGSPTFGFGVEPSATRFNPMTLTQGYWATRPGQVVLDKGSADKHHFAVRDRIRIAADGPVRSFEVVGIARFGNVDTIGSATFAVWDVPTARSMLHRQGFDAISVAAKPGVSAKQLAGELAGQFPQQQVRTGAE